MTSLTQSRRLMTLQTVLGGDVFVLEQLKGREAICEPFQFELLLLTHDREIELHDLIGSPMTIALNADRDKSRSFHGHVSEIRSVDTNDGHTSYRATLAPFSIFMEQRFNCRIFHNKSSQEIIQILCEDYPNIAKVEFEIQTNVPHTMRVQYNESDWNLILRLCEENGWSYFFRHDANSHTLVIRELSSQCEDIVEPKLPFDEGALVQDSIHRWGKGERIQESALSIRRFDYKCPSSPEWMTIPHEHPAKFGPETDRYLYDGAYSFGEFNDGKGRALRQVESRAAKIRRIFGTGNVRRLEVGRSFTLGTVPEHVWPREAPKAFQILALEHDACNNYLQMQKDGERNRFSYSNRMEVCLKTENYRAPLDTVKPLVRGPQTAIVVGPAGEEIFCDEMGRVKIQFHWDREGKKNESSSAWVRVSSSWAGSQMGFIAIPRIGMEVIVDFLEGNPDHPIITGCVYNGDNQPPWSLPANKTQSGFYTASTPGRHYDRSNALRFEDKKGSEEIWIHAEKDQRIEVENDEKHEVGNDRIKHIKHDETTTVANNRTENVGANEDITIGANRTEFVGANESITITGHQNLTVMQTKNENILLTDTQQVGLAKTTTVGGAYALTVALGKNEVVGLGSAEEVGLGKTTQVGKSYSINVADELSITVGNSSLVMKKDGTILINGQKIKIDGSSGVKVTGKVVDLN